MRQLLFLVVDQQLESFRNLSISRSFDEDSMGILKNFGRPEKIAPLIRTTVLE